MTKHVVTLDDRYEQIEGQVLISSMQALVRLPLDQARRDRAAGLTTGGYITGYRGSPITTLDAQLWSSKKLLDRNDIHFEPGLNEELAATSLRGTQQLTWFGASKYQGVFAMWYAKGLGVDRACEALKLANFEGTHQHGGVLVVAGDDHAAKSSASAHQSEHTLIVGFIPVLAPSTTDEILSYGQFGWEMSRYSGLYVGLKTVTDTLDLTSSTILPELRIVRPELPTNLRLNLQRGMSALVQEDMVLNKRLPAAMAFARANGLNRVDFAAQQPALTIVTAGKPWLDVRQALADLGLDDARAAALGISLVKLGMTWPLDQEFARQACNGAREILVVEEKRPVIEEQLLGALYTLDQRPAVHGKRDEAGAVLFPLDNVIDPPMVRRAIVRRLEALGRLDEVTRAKAAQVDAIEAAAVAPPVAIRPAYFCSGCPHNTSTNIPDGSIALGATGCHGLAAFMPERRTMNVVGMGAEGLAWVGAQHFVETSHVFSNMGDGTYTHSGLLAIRAAVAANTNVTFKILFNDAVAMTGGQPAEGSLTVPQIVQELIAERVDPVIVVSDNPEAFEGGVLPAGVRILHRDNLDTVQREVREVKGVSAIVYEQVCANEKRRRRKRGKAVDPDLRLFINPAVCEGCGDCSVQSNCMSVTPLETEFGRKREIDQSNCNKDYSCIKGYCPSFVSLRGAKPAKRAVGLAGLQPLIDALPEPTPIATSDGFSMLVTGIGGTGVLTVGAILGMAAQIEGKAVKVLDMTGMAQKGGGVMSHVRFADDVADIPSARLGPGQTDLLIACDLIVASGPDVARTLRPDSRVIANEDVVPTGQFQTKADLDLRSTSFLPSIRQRVGEDNVALLRANELAAKLMGDTIFTNLMMVGYAAQKGLLPVGIEAVAEAVALNGTAVKANLDAMTLGRVAALHPQELLDFANLSEGQSLFPQTLDAMLESRGRHLAAYQDEGLARRHRAFVERIGETLKARDIAGGEGFLIAVANQLARLMAYKDEYEVARLYSLPAFKETLKGKFDGDYKLSLNLGSPILALGRRDKKTGRPKKVEVGAWILPLFGILAKFKGLRGTPLDPFGYQGERRMERRLIGEYQDLILGLADRVTEDRLPIAEQIAAAAAEIRGYGPVKEKGVETFHAKVEELMAAFEKGPAKEKLAA